MLSIVIPLYNEKDSLKLLYEKILEQVKNRQHEIIFIDDGSTDGSFEVLTDLQKQNPSVRVYRLRRNQGKSLALNIGFQKAKGDIIITMDADLQDDPREIPRFIEKIEEGFDLVSGWKHVRRDPMEKVVASKLFNKVVSFFSGIKLHDFNCGFKAYRREVIKIISVYGDLHRLIPVLADEFGFSITEIKVEHYPRLHGKSKFGYSRYIKGIFDLFTILCLVRYSRKPMHIIGSVSLINIILGLVFICYTAIMKFGLHQTGMRPSLFIGLFLVTVGILMILNGFIADLMLYNYQSRKKNNDEYLMVDDKEP